MSESYETGVATLADAIAILVELKVPIGRIIVLARELRNDYIRRKNEMNREEKKRKQYAGDL